MLWICYIIIGELNIFTSVNYFIMLFTGNEKPTGGDNIMIGICFITIGILSLLTSILSFDVARLNKKINKIEEQLNNN